MESSIPFNKLFLDGKNCDPINYTDPTGMYPYGPYGNHGAPGLDPDYRLKQIQQEGLRHGIPNWAWAIGGGIQDVLFFEQYGMSRLDAIERQMQYQAWRSTLSALNISWDPSTYYVKSRGYWSGELRERPDDL